MYIHKERERERYIYIENAHATPPHRDVFLRLGRSDDLLGFCSLWSLGSSWVCLWLHVFDTILDHFPCLKDVFGSFGHCGGHFGRSWDLSCGLTETSCEKRASSCFNMGGFGLRGGPLAAMGCFFSDSDCNNSAQKRPKDYIRGFVKIVIFLYVCWCFGRLASPSGRPDGCLETFLEHLAAHGGHFGDTCAAYLCHDGFK